MSVVVRSFHSSVAGVGLPLGNLTSQLLVNIYMNEFDQFMKHRLKAKYYLRYADDFAVLSTDKMYRNHSAGDAGIFGKQTQALHASG